MTKKTKVIYIIGSVIIGVAALLIILFGLMAGGVLNARQSKLIISSATRAFVYDGREHTDASWEYLEDTGYNVAEGHTVKVTVTGAITDAGSTTNRIDVTVTDKRGADVTADYEIVKYEGRLTVTKRKLTVVSDSAVKEYDGTPLTAESSSVTDGTPVPGHSVYAAYTAALTDAGSALNSFSATVKTALGKDVTANYDITKIEGVLTVNPRRITLQSPDAEKIYDGKAFSAADYGQCEVAEGSLVGGEEITANFAQSFKAAGEARNEFTATILSGGRDVTANYDIEYFYGTLKINRREIGIASSDGYKEYDGFALTAQGYTLVHGSLADGHYCSVETFGTITNAGFAANYFSAAIYEAGADVTANYEIIRTDGVLTVAPRTVRFTSVGGEKEYDGTPLTAEGCTLTDGSLISGHEYKAVYTGTRTDAGVSPNAFEVEITADGEDVTANYQPEYVYGELNVKKRRIAFSTLSAMKIYDGLPLTCGEWRIDSEIGLIAGHFIDNVVMPAEITDAGTQQNYVSELNISDGERDVTENYSVSYFYGNLSVSPRLIAVRSGSAAKDYDGTPLTCDEYDIVSATQPVEGHVLTVVISGTRTEPGESENVIAEVIVSEGDRNVTLNYNVLKQQGALVVRDGGHGGAGGGSGNLDESGSLGGNGLEDGGAEEELALRVLSDEGGRVYLRYMSFGAYNMRGWDAAPQYGYLLGNKYSFNYLPAAWLNGAGFTSSRIKIQAEGDNYFLPYYADFGDYVYDVQTSDVKYAGDTSAAYSLFYYSYDYLKHGRVSGGTGAYASAERTYANFVKDNYLYVPAATAAYLDGVIRGNAFDASDPDVIGKVARYISGAAEYNLDYDRALDSAADIAVGFLRDFKQGVCRHFASAATLMYRALGIPARYVIGYVGETVAGEWTDITTASAHAWVEVYIDGFGWVQIEVTGGAGNGEGGDDTADDVIVVKPVTEYVLYDGREHYYNGARLQGLHRLELQGYTYTAEVTGGGRTAGKHKCVITAFTLYNAEGEDVTEGCGFRFKFSTGTLHIYMAEITVRTQSGEKVYDGTPLTAFGAEVEGLLISGHSVEYVRAAGSQLGVGVSRNDYEIRIVDGAGADVTDCYKINGETGALEVTPREITVTAGSAEKIYDGNALTCGDYKVDGLLCDGHSIAVEINGSQIRIGRSENRIVNVVITDADGKDVTANYTVNRVNGMLYVNPPIK